MNKRRHILCGILIVMLTSSLSAQYSHWEIGVNGCYSMPNNFNMMEYATGAAGMDVTWLKRSVGDEYWQLYRHYPTFGVRGSFLYIPGAIYGHRFGIEGLVRAPLGKRLDYNIGFGLSAFTRPQYFTGDAENIFISSVVSCLIDVGLNYRVGEKLVFNASMLHSSNGMLLRPNKGLNILQFGVAVKLGNEYERTLDWIHARERITDATPERNHEWGVAFSGGTVMSRDESDEGYHFCYDLSLYYQRYVTPVFAYGGALDFWYNNDDASGAGAYAYSLPLYFSAMGVMEFFWGPISLKAGVGPVLLGSYHIDLPIYERVGVYYNFGRNFTGVALNAHLGRIEFIEFTFGRRF